MAPKTLLLLAGLIDRAVKLRQLLANARLIVGGKIPAMDPKLPRLLRLDLPKLVQKIARVVGGQLIFAKPRLDLASDVLFDPSKLRVRTVGRAAASIVTPVAVVIPVV